MVDRRTKEGKQLWQEFTEANADKEIITRDQDAQIEAMHRSLMRHPMANHLLTCAGEAEQQLDWEIDGQPYRGVLDKLTDSGFIVDIKTTDDASPRGFAYSVRKYRYHVQAAMYLDGVMATGTKPEAFILIAIEKAPPYLCAVYYLTDSDIEAGREAYKQDVETYRRCMSLNDWLEKFDELLTYRESKTKTKECALIMVNIMLTNSTFMLSNGELYYWNEVKKEIENL